MGKVVVPRRRSGGRVSTCSDTSAVGALGRRGILGSCRRRLQLLVGRRRLDVVAAPALFALTVIQLAVAVAHPVLVTAKSSSGSSVAGTVR